MADLERVALVNTLLMLASHCNEARLGQPVSLTDSLAPTPWSYLVRRFLALR